MTVKTTAALLTLSLAATGVAEAQARGARSGSAGAQQAQAPKCDIQNTGSTQVANAYTALGKYNEAQADAEKPKHLAEAIRQLTGAADKPGNEVARNWVMGQSLVAWSLIENQPLTGTRSTFGYASNPEGTVELLVAADSAFDAVEAAMPGCTEQISHMRRLAYVTAANRAVAAFNAGNVDEATALANQSLAIHTENAPTYHLLGNVAIKKQDWATAEQMLGRAAEQAKSDSSLKSLHQNALESQAAVLGNLAATAQGDQQKQYAAKQAAIYRELSTVNPAGAAQYQTQLTQALAASGDTAAVAGIYSQMTANPANYSASELIDAGIGAANAERMTDAIALLEAGTAKNRFYRDALFALAFAYSTQNNFPKMAEMTQRLIAVDPSNPDNFNMLAQAYQGILSSNPEKNAQRAYLDSLQKTIAHAEKMPVKVAFTDFQSPSAEQRVLNGTIENRGAAPADFVLKVEFLDETGNVVATKEESVTQVAPQGSKPFSITGDGKGIVAFRYAPVTTP